MSIAQLSALLKVTAQVNYNIQYPTFKSVYSITCVMQEVAQVQ